MQSPSKPIAIWLLTRSPCPTLAHHARIRFAKLVRDFLHADTLPPAPSCRLVLSSRKVHSLQACHSLLVVIFGYCLVRHLNNIYGRAYDKKRRDTGHRRSRDLNQEQKYIELNANNRMKSNRMKRANAALIVCTAPYNVTFPHQDNGR